MNVVNSFNHPSKLCKDNEHRMRVMHMLMRVGRRMGHGTGKLAGFVMYCADGKMYSVTGTDIWCHPYHEFMYAVRSGEIPFEASETPAY